MSAAASTAAPSGPLAESPAHPPAPAAAPAPIHARNRLRLSAYPPSGMCAPFPVAPPRVLTAAKPTHRASTGHGTTRLDAIDQEPGPPPATSNGCRCGDG